MLLKFNDTHVIDSNSELMPELDDSDEDLMKEFVGTGAKTKSSIEK